MRSWDSCGEAGCKCFINFKSIHADLEQPAVIAHGMIGIGTQIHDDLMNLRRVGHDRAGLRVYGVPNLNGFGKGSAQSFRASLMIR